MKSGKIAEAVLKRSVIKAVNKQEKQHMVSAAGIGSDAGLFAYEEMIGVMATSCTTLAGWEEGLGIVAVCRACNSLAAAGSVPVAVTVQLMLPESLEEAKLKDTMKEILEACETAGVVLASGHTQVSSFVEERVISVTAIGTAQAAASLQEDVYGSDLVMTKSAGFAGAALLAKNYREKLHERYTYAFIDKAIERMPLITVQPEVQAVKALGVRHMHDVAEGGVFGAVWELCERLHAGVELELKTIPILQETVEISEYFDINPYQLKGDGALLFLTHDSATAIRELKALGIEAKVIGRITDSNDRVLLNGEDTRFLEPNRVDEYERAIEKGKG